MRSLLVTLLIVVILSFLVSLMGCDGTAINHNWPYTADQSATSARCRDYTTWTVTGDGKPIPEIVHQCL